jgi:hypothetical protein
MSTRIAVLDDGTRVPVRAKKDGEHTMFVAINPPENFDPMRITHYEEA